MDTRYRVRRDLRGRVLVLALLGASGTVACTLPNPGFSEGSGSATESGDGSAGSESSTTADLTGEGMTGTGTGGGTASETTSTATTEPEPGVCGDGVLDPGEICDDGNDDADDGCVACTIPKSCAEILGLAPGSPSGEYEIDPGLSGEPWPVECDMVKDGGGWTGFSVDDICNNHLMSNITTLEPAVFEGLDECPPWAAYPNVDPNSGPDKYAYNWDIFFSPGFTAFFLREYSAKGIGNPELNFRQQTWDDPYKAPNGALSLGDAKAAGPSVHWADDEGENPDVEFDDGEVREYPAEKQNTIFTLEQSTDTLRIAWSEAGIFYEGLYPWWGGRIFVR